MHVIVAEGSMTGKRAASGGPPRPARPEPCPRSSELRLLPQPQTKLLVVDDETGLREMLAYELSAEGFVVTAVPSGMSAVEMLKRESFDVVITDLNMPGMDGLETLAALKAIDEAIEVIVATGYATVETAVACMQAGAYDYVQKPYNVAALGVQVRRAVEKRHLRGAVALYELSRTLLTTLDQGSLVKLVLDEGRKVLSAEAALLVLGDPSVETSYHSSGGATIDPRVSRMLAERTWSSAARSHLVEDFRDSSIGSALNSMLAYPLVVRDRRLGSLLLFRASGCPNFRDTEVRLGGIFASQIAMAFENARLYGEVERRAATDELTDLNSRRALFESLRREIQRTARTPGSPITLIVIDVDHFKQVNDTLGHSAGDQALRELAGTLRQNVRGSDVVARLGGEEFVVVLPSTTVAAAEAIAERIRAAVARPGRSSIPVTVSLGIAGHDRVLPEELLPPNATAELADLLLRRADLALYRAKREGRNRVRTWQPGDQDTCAT